MKHHLIAALAASLLTCAAHAASTSSSYAVISLVGDKLDIVTYEPQIGSQLDSNKHMLLALPQDEIDIAALRAVNRSLHAAVPGAQVALLAASTPDSFADQDRIFGGDHVSLPAEIDAAVRREGAGLLVLVTKRRGEARMKVGDGYLGGGKLVGLGYYIDTQMAMQNSDTGVQAMGFLAPYVYIDVSLVDLASLTLVRREAIMTSSVIGPPGKTPAAHPWDSLTSQEKVATLEAMLATALERVVPTVVTGVAAKAE
jgi:hypothetical protein